MDIFDQIAVKLGDMTCIVIGLFVFGISLVYFIKKFMD